MKRIFKTLFLSLMFSFSALAQIDNAEIKDASYTVGAPYKVVDAPNKLYFYQDNELMTVKISGAKVTIQKLSTSDLEIKSTNVYKEMPKGFLLEGVEEINNKYYLFYSIWDKPNKSEQLFCREIDFAAGTLNDEEKALIKTDGKVTGAFAASAWGWGGSVTDKFDFYKSFDESKFMVTYRKKPEEKKDAKSYDLIGMFVFDENMEELWGDEVKMPYTEKKMDNIDYAVDKKGNTYILARVYNDNSTDLKKRRSTEANYHIEILRVPSNSKDIKSKDIDKTVIKIKDKFIQSITLYEGPEDYMICAGFYNKGKNMTGANGIFQFKIGKEGDLYDTKSYEFPTKMLNLYMSERAQKRNEKQAEKGRGEFSELVLRNFFVGSDGSIVLVGEQFYIREVTTYDTKGNARTTYYYHYNDIIIAKIAADGELAWMKKLPKRQMGVNSGRSGMSFAYMYDDVSKNHYMVFLDNIKNLKLETNHAPYEHRNGAGGFLTAYEVSHEEGTVSKVSILDTKKVNGKKIYQFAVNRVFNTGPGEFVFEAYKKKKQDILIKVDLNKE